MRVKSGEAHSLQNADSSILLEALWDREARLMALMSREHRYIDVNNAYTNFLGVSRETLVGEHVSDVLGHGHYQNVIKASLDQCFDGEPVSFETEYNYPNIGIRNMQVEYTPLQSNGDNRIEHVLVTIYDVTDLKQSQKRLELESQRLEAVIEGTRAGTWQWNAQTNAMIVNERWAEMIGYTREELEPIDGSTWFSLLSEEDREDAVFQSDLHVNGETEFYDCEFRLRHKDGHWVWVHTRGRIAEWIDGKPLWVFGTHTDITDRKNEEARRLEVREALAQREGQLSDIIKSVPGSLVRYLVTADGEEQILYFSEKGKDVWEISDDEVGKAELLWEMVHEEFMDGLEESLRISGEEERYWEQSWKITTRSGRIKWLNGRGYPRRQLDGAVIWNILVLDVTPLKETEQMLRESEARARAASEAKTEFLNMMNHELRTPLNAIIGPLDLLDCDASDEQKAVLNLMRPAAEHLLSLINDILNLSKVQSGNREVELELIDLSAIVDDGLGIFQLQAAQKGIGYFVECKGELPEQIETDQRFLKQILMNLVSNAIKFTASGSVHVTVSVETHPGFEYGRLCFEIKDTGIGISEDNLEKVFRPFQQVDTEAGRAQQGTGLGLPIALELAGLLGGELSLSSQLGEGSVFTLALPLSDGLEAPAVAPKNQSVSSSASDSDSLSILVVEDTSENVEFFKLILARLGRNADFALDGQSAIELFEEKPYDVVFCDIRLPDMSGEDVAKRLRVMKGGAECSIIANTAYVTEAFKAKLMAQGFDGFLPKPMRIGDVDSLLIDCSKID